MSELERIKVSIDEVRDPRLDEVIARDVQARGSVAAPANREPPKVPLYYNPMLVYPLLAGLAAFGVWALTEPLISEANPKADKLPPFVGSFLVFGGMSAAIGVMLAMADALLSRNLVRALHCAVIGLGVGLVVAILGTVVASFVFGLGNVAVAMMLEGSNVKTFDDINGIPFFMFMVARAMAWTLVAMGMGISQGIALKSKKLVMNGLVGGVIGGFLGGLTFDPIYKIFHNPDVHTGALSRAFGMTTIGVAVGFFIGLVESMAKDAWLYMKAGPLAGKQFVIYKDPTVLGSSPKSDVYLFKDAAIEPKHAEIRAVGTRYQIKDLGTQQGVYVNGRRVESHMLSAGDQVVLGETVLEYAERPRK